MPLDIDTSNPDQVKIRFIWPAADPPGAMSVVGTFNRWTPGLDELVENADGTRSVTLGLPYGQQHRFRYLGQDGQWFDEPDADERTEQGSILYAITRTADEPGR